MILKVLTASILMLQSNEMAPPNFVGTLLASVQANEVPDENTAPPAEDVEPSALSLVRLTSTNGIMCGSHWQIENLSRDKLITATVRFSIPTTLGGFSRRNQDQVISVAPGQTAQLEWHRTPGCGVIPRGADVYASIRGAYFSS